MRRAATRSVQVSAAANLAAWHESSTRALGLRPRTGARWWTCAMPAPNVYYTAVSLVPATNRRDRARMGADLRDHVHDQDTSLVSVCDAWDQLDLRSLGLQRRMAGRWLWRPPLGSPATSGTASPPTAEPLRVEPVVDRDTLARFERTMVAGFGARPPIGPFDIHAPGILDDPAMHVLAGWVDDEMVACAMTYVTDVAGIYGVATLPAWRRRGYASTMADAAAAVAPDLVAVLQPTPEAGVLYERIGFTELGTFSHWS